MHRTGDNIECEQCGTKFAFTQKMKQSRKYCARACYREASRQFETRAYPEIWHNGKKVLLHRFIYEQAHPEEAPLTPSDIIHHKDENPFNRAIDNLERISGEESRAEHLRKHNYFRDKPSKPDVGYDEEMGW